MAGEGEGAGDSRGAMVGRGMGCWWGRGGEEECWGGTGRSRRARPGGEGEGEGRESGEPGQEGRGGEGRESQARRGGGAAPGWRGLKRLGHLRQPSGFPGPIYCVVVCV